MSYAARTRYDEPGRAERYAGRSARRDEEEWRLVERAIEALPARPADALDVPCGTGRIAERLIGRGIPTRCADLSPAMRAEAEKRLSGREGFRGVLPLDLEAPGGNVLPTDLVVSLRFLHHLPDAATRARVLSTLASLTRGHLLLSFHHPVSAHNLARALRRAFGGPRGERYTISPARLAKEARAAGLEIVGFHPLARYRREFWLAVLRPSSPAYS